MLGTDIQSKVCGFLFCETKGKLDPSIHWHRPSSGSPESYNIPSAESGRMQIDYESDIFRMNILFFNTGHIQDTSQYFPLLTAALAGWQVMQTMQSMQ